MRVALALGLVGAGWAAAKAQTATPTFELQVDAPGGDTTIHCVRGCKLSWVERGVNPNTTPRPDFQYGCGAARCDSGKIGGWVE